MNKRIRRKIKGQMYDACTTYLRETNVQGAPTVSNLRWLVFCLRSFASWDNIKDYGYKYEGLQSIKGNLFYLSDRMNGGRARAVLRMLREYHGRSFTKNAKL